MPIEPESLELELGLILAIVGLIFSLALKFKRASVPHVRVWKILMACVVAAGVVLIWLGMR
jgi:hypothetical protein